jgi:hypothetical protein
MPVAKQTSNYKPAPAGTHIARCYGCIALGTQHSEMFNSEAFKIVLLFELSNETIERDGKTAPISINKEYTLSLGKKSVLRKHLETWRGRPFTDEELKGFEVGNVVGSPCMVSIIHVPRQDGTGVRDRLESVTAVPKGYPAPPQFNPSVKYEIEQGRDAGFQALPQWLQNKIAACVEWNGGPVESEPSGPPDDGGPSEPDSKGEMPF